MRKWLSGWFTWRFTLARLVVAVVILGVLIGLNTSQIARPLSYSRVCDERIVEMVSYRGWPFCFTCTSVDFLDSDVALEDLGLPVPAFESFKSVGEEWGYGAQVRQWDWANRERLLAYDAQCDWLTWTHQTYRLLDLDSARWTGWNGELRVSGVLINALFALSVLALMLFLQIPRRKEAAKVE